MADTREGRTVAAQLQTTSAKGTPARTHSVPTSESRSALPRVLNRIVPGCYDINQFLKIIPRTIPSDDITEQLIEKGIITAVLPNAGESSDGSKFKLVHFPSEPRDIPETENKVFRRLKENIFEKMAAAVAQKNPEDRPTTEFMTESNLNTTPEFDIKSRTRSGAHTLSCMTRPVGRNTIGQT